MNSLVSIIIPTFNRQDFIKDAILCATNQTYTNIEVVIVDNCSTDNTVLIIEKYAKEDERIRYYVNNENVGPVYNWQKCINYARGEYIKILWSDDLITNSYVEDTLTKFDENTAFVMSGYKIYDFEKKTDLYKSFFQHESYSTLEYLKHSLIYTSYDFPLSPGCAIFRLLDIKKAFVVDIHNIDGLDSKKNGAGNDLLIMLNIASDKKYSKIVCIKKHSSIFRAHTKSFSISDKLDLYYEYARLSFYNKCINRNNEDLILYKERLKFLKIKYPKYNNINSLINNTNSNLNLLSFIYIIKKLIYNIKFKMHKYIYAK